MRSSASCDSDGSIHRDHRVPLCSTRAGGIARIVKPWYQFAAVAQIPGDVSSRHSGSGRAVPGNEKTWLTGSASKEFGRY
jgi:hypothetical protein